MLESGAKLLRDILFNDSEQLPLYTIRERVEAAEGLGRIGTADAIYYLRDFIVKGDHETDILAEAIDAYGWALMTFKEKKESIGDYE